MNLFSKRLAALAAIVCVPLAALSAAAQPLSERETKWAFCMFPAIGGNSISLLVFEPFQVATHEDSFPSISERFDDEVGVASVLPGHRLLTEYVIGLRGSDSCKVFASESEAWEQFEAWRNASGFRVVEVVRWAPADEVTGLAASTSVARSAAPHDRAPVGPEVGDESPAEDRAAAREAEERDRREAEETARLNREAAEFAANQVAENEAARRKAEAERKAYEAELARVEQEKAQHERAMEQHRREREEANRRQQEYFAAQRRHALCIGGDRKACADIKAGKQALADASTDEEASTEEDATRCVSAPVVSADTTFRGSTQAVVINGCDAPVDVRVCLMRTGGWNCGTTWNLAPQARWAHTSFESDGQVFWDARVSTSSRALAKP